MSPEAFKARLREERNISGIFNWLVLLFGSFETSLRYFGSSRFGLDEDGVLGVELRKAYFSTSQLCVCCHGFEGGPPVMLCSKAAFPYVTEGFIFKGRRIAVVAVCRKQLGRGDW